MAAQKITILCLAICCYVAIGQAKAQSTAGLTGVADTSFTIEKELQKNKKHYPQITIAEAAPLKKVKGILNISYARLPHRSLQLDVFYSTKKKGKKPAIVMIHGGGWRSGNKAQHHALAKQLAQRGYVVVTPEYRLSTEALYPAAVCDLKKAIAWVKSNGKNYRIDTSKIVVAGFSAGGTLAALIGTTATAPEWDTHCQQENLNTSVQAIIDIDGTLSFVHPESGEGDDSKKTSAATYWLGYSKAEAPELWAQASPLTHVGKETPPTLFINSGVDRMHAGRDDFRKVLVQHGIYSEVKTFADAPHAFPFFHPWFEPMVQTIDAFLQKVFPPKNVSKPF